MPNPPEANPLNESSGVEKLQNQQDENGQDAGRRLSLHAFQLAQVQQIQPLINKNEQSATLNFDQEEENHGDIFEMTPKQMRVAGAGLSIYAGGMSGFLRESANVSDLLHLQATGRPHWLKAGKADLPSVRYELQNRFSSNKADFAEQVVLERIKVRGAVTGAVSSVGGLIGTMAVDTQFFPDTPRTSMSCLNDFIGLPAAAAAIRNPYLKAAGMVGVHTLGRLYDAHATKDWQK